VSGRAHWLVRPGAFYVDGGEVRVGVRLVEAAGAQTVRSLRTVAVMRAGGAQELVSARRAWRRRAHSVGADRPDPYAMVGVTVAGILAAVVIGAVPVVLCALIAALVGLPLTGAVVLLVVAALLMCLVGCWFAQPVVLHITDGILRSAPAMSVGNGPAMQAEAHSPTGSGDRCM
jgi:hypothetical protein